jgi:hypothetical protein
MGRSLDGDSADALDHAVRIRSLCTGHIVGLQRPTPDVPRRSKHA